MAIKGSLKEASLADVCQLLALGLKTGCLSITDRSKFAQIFFDKGRITYAHVVNRRDRIGDLLVRDGVLEQAQLDAVLSLQAEQPDKRIGELLVERGVLGADVLGRYVRLQIEEAIYHLFTWSRGNFFFEPDQRPQSADIVVSVNPEGLLLEAARRVDEWSQIEKKIPSFDLIFDVERSRLEQSGVELSAEHERIVPLLDGRRTVQEVIDATGLSEFEVGQALYGLIHAGFAHRIGRRSVSEVPRAKEGELAERRNLGTAFYRTHLFADAQREFQRVLAIRPSDLGARFHLGLIDMQQGRYRAALRHFKALLEECGPNAAALVNMAHALRRLGRTEDALFALEQAESLRPGMPAVALARALACMASREFTAAEAAFEEYRRRMGETEPGGLYHHHVALCRAMRGDLPGALEFAEGGVERVPDCAPLLQLCGLIQERRGDLDAADQWYRRALDEDGTLPQVHKNLGDVAYRRGDHAEALRHYGRAAELDPTIGDDTFAKLGNLYYKVQDREAAVRSWRRALELNPTNQIVSNNLRIVTHAAG